jgi:hypothetical protein
VWTEIYLLAEYPVLMKSWFLSTVLRILRCKIASMIVSRVTLYEGGTSTWRTAVRHRVRES